MNVTTQVLASWQNFYVIVGSAAGALTGLQFVVITLMTQARTATNIRDIHAFGSPTVMHFCSALLISAVLTAPWPTLINLATCVGALALAGLAYSLRALWHARKAAYKPDMEDWFWYAILPVFSHLALLGAAVLIWSLNSWGLPIVAADALVFLLLGVHNSWDTVTFIAIRHANHANSSPQDQKPNS